MNHLLYVFTTGLFTLTISLLQSASAEPPSEPIQLGAGKSICDVSTRSFKYILGKVPLEDLKKLEKEKLLKVHVRNLPLSGWTLNRFSSGYDTPTSRAHSEGRLSEKEFKAATTIKTLTKIHVSDLLNSWLTGEKVILELGHFMEDIGLELQGFREYKEKLKSKKNISAWQPKPEWERMKGLEHFAGELLITEVFQDEPELLAFLGQNGLTTINDIASHSESWFNRPNFGPYRRAVIKDRLNKLGFAHAPE